MQLQINMKNFSMALALATLFLTGCTHVELDAIRKEDNASSSIDIVQKLSKARVDTIKKSETVLDPTLTCLGNTYRQQLEKLLVSKNYPSGYRFKISVSPIQDKTGKVFPAGTAMSDMLTHSLAKFGVFDIVDTPSVSDLALASRVNFLHPNYPIPSDLKVGANLVMSSQSSLPVGVLFPTDFNISGALTQYDESSVLPNSSQSTKIDVDALSVDRSVSAITVGIALRLVDSTTGQVIRNAATNQLLSVNLTNTFYKLRVGVNLFRIIPTSGKDYGIDHTIEVSDPKNFAVQEMLDKAVIELFKGRFIAVLTEDCK